MTDALLLSMHHQAEWSGFVTKCESLLTILTATISADASAQAMMDGNRSRAMHVLNLVRDPNCLQS